MKILVLCTGNSCRSQIAEGYLRHMGPEHIMVRSAGVETHGINPRAIRVMSEDGIDISGHTSNHVDEYREVDFDYVITVCDKARERCPYYPEMAQQLHRDFPDPAMAMGTDEEVMEEFRQVREMIKDFVGEFLQKKVPV